MSANETTDNSGNKDNFIVNLNISEIYYTGWITSRAVITRSGLAIGHIDLHFGIYIPMHSDRTTPVYLPSMTSHTSYSLLLTILARGFTLYDFEKRIRQHKDK